MPISHVKTVTVPDDPTQPQAVRPSDWNSKHIVSLDTSEVMRFFSAGTTSVSNGQLVFANSNGLTFGLATNANGGTLTGSIAPSGAFSGGVSNLGNTLGNTGTNSKAVVLAGGNNITLSQVTDANGATITISGAAIPAQTNQTGDLFAGAQSFGTSSGTFDARTLSIVGSGAISVAASNSAFIISAPVQTAGSDTLGISNLGNTLGTSGVVSGDQVRLILAGGNNVTLSQSINGASATITISGPNTVAQSNQTVGLFAVSNTTQSSSGTVDARSISFEGAGAVSVGISNGSVVISAAAGGQSVQTIGVFGVGNTTGQSSSSTFDARSLSFDGAGIASVGMSGGSIIISVPAGGGGGDGFNIVSLSGNTAGVLTTFLSATLNLAGGNNITLSQTSNSITISGPNQTNQTGNIFVGAQSFGTSSGTFDARTLSINGSGAISVAASNSAFIISAPVQTAESNTFGISNLGNTSGTSGTAASNQARLILAGGNNITLSQSINGGSVTITISGPNTAAQTNQTVGLFAVGNTTQSSSTTADARSLSFDGLGGISVGFTLGSVQISGPQTVAQTNQSLGLFALSNTTQSSSGTADARSLSFAGAGIASVGVTGGTVVISVPSGGGAGLSAGISGGNTLGNSGTVSNVLVFAGGNNITLSGSTAAGGETITISAAAQTNQSGNIFVGAQSFGTSSGTFDARTLSINGSGAISVAASNNGFIISAPVQTAQTIGVYGSSQTVGQSSSSTVDARSFTHVGQGIISLGMSGGSLIISATTVAQTNQTIGLFASSQTTGQSSSSTVDARSISLVGAGGVSVGLSAGSFIISGGAGGGGAGTNTEGISNIGNTSGTSGVISGSNLQLIFAGGNNITLSQSINGSSATITISAFSQTNQSLGAYAVGNTTGQSSSTTLDARTMSFDGAGAISVGYSAGSAIISAPPVTSLVGVGMVSLSSAGSTISIQGSGNVLSVSGNTTGTLTSFSSGTMVFAGGNNVTLSQSSNSITIVGPLLSFFEPREFNHHVSFQSLGQNSLWLWPVTIPVAITISRLNMVLSLNAATAATASQQVGLTHILALYTRASGTSQSLSSVFSTSHTAVQSNNSGTSWLVNWNGNSTSSTNGVNLSGAMTGQKIHTMAMATLLSAGEYWLAVAVSTSSVGSSAVLQVSHAVLTGITNNTFGYPGGTQSSAASLNPMIQPMGTYSATTGAFPGTIHVSQINGMSSQEIPYFNFANFGT